MSIYVEHKETGDFFIFLGGGYGAFQSHDSHSIFNPTKEGTFHMVALCDKKGNIGWVKSDKLRVIHIDGTDIADIQELGEFKK